MKTLAQLEAENVELTKQVSDLTAKTAEDAKKIKAADEAATTHKATTERVTALETENTTLKSENGTLKGENAKLKGDNVTLAQENTKLKGEAKTAGQRAVDVLSSVHQPAVEAEADDATAEATTPEGLHKQYMAITDPHKRGEFYAKHKKELIGA